MRIKKCKGTARGMSVPVQMLTFAEIGGPLQFARPNLWQVPKNRTEPGSNDTDRRPPRG
jgi:hypothetical protein